jgi:aryl-alcohol dehydrogenase-like predicted oxidoreductase
MKYRKLGNSGLKVSELGLGSWQTFGNKITLSETLNCLALARDKGINFIDTADTYGNGEAERLIGKSIKHFPREDFVISTKCYFPVSISPNARGLSRKHIVESVKNSLKNLSLEYIDLLYCHRYDHDTPLCETVSAIDDLIKQGCILYWGISRWNEDEIRTLLEIIKSNEKYAPIAHQHWYNLLNQEPEESIFTITYESGMGIVGYSPLAQGVLSGKYSVTEKPPLNSRATSEESRKMMWDFNSKSLDFMEILKGYCINNDVSLIQLSLGWCLRKQEVSSIIMGASSALQLKQNILAYDTQIDTNIIEGASNLYNNWSNS